MFGTAESLKVETKDEEKTECKNGGRDWHANRKVRMMQSQVSRRRWTIAPVPSQTQCFNQMKHQVDDLKVLTGCRRNKTRRLPRLLAIPGLLDKPPH